MAQETYKYSIEYRERFGFNGTEIYWMEEAFKLFSEKAAEELDQHEKQGKNPIFGKKFFPVMFEEIVFKAKQWSNPPKTWPEDE
tara:strand:+ start:3876 stop:4127 length:252 start_codon:yes stop_codon:yes gene_type:complete